MNTTPRQSTRRLAPVAPPSIPAPADALAELRVRLAEAEETLRAIRTGDVDAVVGTGKQDSKVFTLQGAEHTYRVLIESMNEGALTLTVDKMILYANQRFADLVKCRLEQVTGGSFRRFLSDADRATLRPLMKNAAKTGAKLQVMLHACDGSLIPVQISIRLLPKVGIDQITIGMVVTDLTEARRTEDMLRALTHRVVKVQEEERKRIALELHDGITQLLCGILFHSQALVASLSADEGSSKGMATKLRDIAGKTAEEVERISRNLRPSVLDNLGLVAALRETSTQFANRTGISVKLACVGLAARLPADTEMALYRILQEALRNIEKHSRARNVMVSLTKRGDALRMTINDDGIGFNSDGQLTKARRKGGLGLVSMRERAAFVGGTLTLKSTRQNRGATAKGRSGTEVEISVSVRAHTDENN